MSGWVHLLFSQNRTDIYFVKGNGEKAKSDTPQYSGVSVNRAPFPILNKVIITKRVFIYLVFIICKDAV